MNSTLRFKKIVTNLFKKKTYLLAGLALLLFSNQAKAQINAYVFDESNTALTYTPITGTVLFASGWDDNVANVALPFTFNFNGIGYNATNVSSNGFITFGATAPGTGTFNPINNATAYAGAISAFGQNLLSGSPSSSVSYTTIGTTPNRVFVVQYNEAARTTLGTGLLNLQIHLYETSNIIEVWYDVPPLAPTTTSTFGASRGQLGLRGVNSNFGAGNVNNRREVTLTAPIIPTALGTANTSNVMLNGNTFNTQVTRFRWTPPCYAPSAPTATNLTGTTADISWTAPAIAPPGYQYEVRRSGAPGSGPAGLGASGTLAGTSTTATGLTEGFTYTLYVRSNCGGSNNSAWITGTTFTLPCAATTVPYFIAFDPISDGFTVPGLPVCTINQNAGTGSNWVTTGADFGAGYFDEHLTYVFNANAANTWFITKPVALTAGTTYLIQYIYGGSSEFTFITNRMEVRYGTVGTAAGLAGAIQLDNHPEIKSSPESNIVNFTAPTTDTYYFGFRAYSAANNGSMYLDDVYIDVSNCRQPTGLNAPPVLVSFNNATITWTAPTPSPANGYAYYYNTTGVPPTNGTPATGTVPAGTTLTSLPGLTPSTTYFVWVRGICGFDDFSEWSTNTTFTTLPPPPVYCIPAGTSVDGQGITNVTFGSINNTTGNEAATSFYGNYSGLTTNVPQGATIPVAITFNTAPFNYNTHIWVDWNNDGDFFDAGELLYTGLSGTTNPSVLNASFTVPLTQPLGPRRMRIGGTDFGPFSDPCRTGSWQSYEDYTINVIVAPPALTLSQTTMPAQCGLTNSPIINITSNISDFDVYTWTPSAGVTGNPVLGYTFNTSSTTTYILTASQTSGSFSTNSVSFTYTANETPTPITITTPNGTNSCVNGPAIQLNAGGGIVSNVTVYEENFNSGINGPGQFTSFNTSTGGSNTANPAWTIRPEGYTATGPSWFATFSSNDDTSFVFSNSDSQGSGAASTTRVRLVSPPIDLTGYTAATVSYYHFYQSWVNDVFARVEVTTNGGTTWTTLANYTTNQGTSTNFTQAFLNLNPYVGNVIQIRFDYQTNWGWGWAIDNFRILGSATSDIVWTPAAGLYTNAAGTTPYVAGTGTSVVYAIPTSDTVYTATATAPGPTFCESTQTVAIAVTPQVGGTLSANQVSCDTSAFTNITLTGQVGSIIRWEYADDAAFTVGVTPIANTTTTLTPAQFGTFDIIRYFRAVVGAGVCNPVFSTVASVSTNATVLTGTNVWSNGLPDITKRVIIDGNFTAAANFSACAVTVRPGRTLTVQSGVTVTVQNQFVVEGAIPNTVVFENNASLIQLSDAVNLGSIRYERNTTPVVFHDYTYWSSPVANQTLGTFSPDTAPNRFYIFNSATYSWQNISTASVMDAARGYIIRAPGTFSATVPSVFTGAFYGVPHNGPYSASVTVSGLQNRNLLGNPYPSAIDADLLYLANSAVLQGNFFFWTHNTPITANLYTSNDYAAYNATGGTGTAAMTTGVNTSIPTGNIAAGQGFFVQGLASGTVNYENTMRLTGSNNLFFRSPNAPATLAVEKHRIWLNIINQQGAYKQMLLGYVQGATNAVDNAYDAEVTEAGNVVSLYSLNTGKKLTIQGRALPFDVLDEVPLGFRTTIAGNYAIELENFDGLFEEGQTIYLEDKWLNVIHNLNESNYNFTTAVGTFDDRFEVQFIDGTLSVDNPVEASNAIVVYKNSETIFINSSTLMMSDVKLFDVRGRLITSKQDILASEVRFSDLNIANQLILVQITTTDGAVITKKVAY